MIMSGDAIYSVTLVNGSGFDDRRPYAVCAALPDITGRGIQPESIQRTICYATPHGIPNTGETLFSFKKEYFAFIGHTQHEKRTTGPVDTVVLEFSFRVRLGDTTGNGSIIQAVCDNDGTQSLAPLDDINSTPQGAFAIYCKSSHMPHGHNVVVGIAQSISGKAVVLAAVPYIPGTRYDIRPRQGLWVGLHRGTVGQVVRSFQQNADPIFFPGFEKEMRVVEGPDGHFVAPNMPRIDREELDTAGHDREPRMLTLLSPVTFSEGTKNIVRQSPAPSLRNVPLGGNNKAVDGEDDGEEDDDNDDDDGDDCEEDEYDLLKEIDTVFLIDDSGSMTLPSAYNKDTTRWDEVKDLLSQIAPICTIYDEDGIDVYFLNAASDDRGDVDDGRAAGGYRGVTNGERVIEIFNGVTPRGTTPTGRRLREILSPYMKKFERLKRENNDCKPLSIIIITDGKPDKQVEVVAAIRDTAMRLDNARAEPRQVGLQFFQVGKDKKATAALKDLDDNIGRRRSQRQFRDIVDTTTWDGTGTRLTGDGILKAVTGGADQGQDLRELEQP
jgi:hypothetical protein